MLSSLSFPRLAGTLFVGLAFFAPVASARQCAKPPVPSSGLAITTTIDQLVTYSDGYLTEGYLVHPSSPAPSCGWPLVVYVHGFPGSKSGVLGAARALARRGFAVWAYDVRGQGDAMTLNPSTTGFTFNGPDEKFDLAQEILFVRSQFGALVNPDRTAVAGTSQGAITSWFAAALSETALTVPGRGTIAFPRIEAVSPHATVADVHEAQLPNGSAFLTSFAQKLFGNPSMYTRDPSVPSLWRPFFLADDPAGLLAAWQAEPHRLWGDSLADTAVAVLYHQAYHDSTSPPLFGVERFAEIPESTPKRVVLSTGGHGSPPNQYEFDFRTELQVRWFDRFLWDIQNEVELEARVIRAAMPLDLANLNDIDHLWGHRFDADLQASDVTHERVYLGDGGTLEEREPTGPAATTMISHQVAAAYTPSAWGSSPQMRSLPTILANIPLSERVFSLAPLACERELGGPLPVSLSLLPGAARFQLNVKLSARIPGASTDFAICAISRGVLDATAGVPLRFDVDLPTAACVLPAGTILKLTVRNHWTFDDPMPVLGSTISVPYFQSSVTEVRHGSGVEASFVDLPYRSGVRLALTSARLSAEGPGGMVFQVLGGSARAGDAFFILSSTSGHVPGFVLGGALLPLHIDRFTLNGPRQTRPGAGAYRGFGGILDAQGEGRVTYRRPGLSALFGMAPITRLSFAAWSPASDGSISVSNPLDLILR